MEHMEDSLKTLNTMSLFFHNLPQSSTATRVSASCRLGSAFGEKNVEQIAGFCILLLQQEKENKLHIEKNVSIIRAKAGKGRPAKYPFPDMEVGDSLFAEGQDAQGLMAVAAHGWARTHNAKFIARTVEGGCRVWRIA